MKKQGNAKEYMSFDDAVPVLIRLCAIMVPIMAVIMGLLVTNRVGLGYDGFAADSHERIYAGRSGVIDIYENGKKVGEAEAPSSRWYSFMIDDNDRIISVRGAESYYISDLDGREIEKREYSSDVYDEILKRRKQFSSPAGREYTVSNIFGYYRVLRDDGVCAFAMPVFDYIINLMLFAMFPCLLTFVLVLLTKMDRIPWGRKKAPSVK